MYLLKYFNNFIKRSFCNHCIKIFKLQTIILNNYCGNTLTQTGTITDNCTH